MHMKVDLYLHTNSLVNVLIHHAKYPLVGYSIMTNKEIYRKHTNDNHPMKREVEVGMHSRQHFSSWRGRGGVGAADQFLQTKVGATAALMLLLLLFSTTVSILFRLGLLVSAAKMLAIYMQRLGARYYVIYSPWICNSDNRKTNIYIRTTARHRI